MASPNSRRDNPLTGALKSLMLWKNLLKAGTSFFLANIFNKASIFLLTLLLANILTSESMGELSIFQVLFLATWTALGLGINPQINRILNNKRYRNTGKTIHALIGSIIVAHLGLALLLFLYFSIKNFENSSIYLILPATSLAHCLYQLQLACLRQLKKVNTYLIVELGCTTASVSLTVILIYVTTWDWHSRVIAITFAFAVFSIVLYVKVFREIYPYQSYSFSDLAGGFKRGRSLVAYLLPIVFLSYSDRFIIKFFESDSEVGIYTVLFQISLSVLIILESFLKAWSPYLYKELNDEQPNLVNLKYGYAGFTLLGAIASAAMAAFWINCIPIVLSEDYQSHQLIVVTLCLSQWLYCLHHAFAAPLISRGDSKRLTQIALICCWINVACNLALIPQLGITGAAISYLCTCAIMCGISAKNSLEPFFKK